MPRPKFQRSTRHLLLPLLVFKVLEPARETTHAPVTAVHSAVAFGIMSVMATADQAPRLFGSVAPQRQLVRSEMPLLERRLVSPRCRGVLLTLHFWLDVLRRR